MLWYTITEHGAYYIPIIFTSQYKNRSVLADGDNDVCACSEGLLVTSANNLGTKVYYFVCM